MIYISQIRGWLINLIIYDIYDITTFNENELLFLSPGGKGISPEDIARTICDAIQQYSESENYQAILKRVTVVTFKAGALEKFVGAIKSHRGLTPQKESTLFSCKLVSK